jgi:prolipoprotein diacylglyceryltransferase
MGQLLSLPMLLAGLWLMWRAPVVAAASAQPAAAAPTERQGTA